MGNFPNLQVRCIFFHFMYTYLPTYVPLKNCKKAPTYLPKMPFRRIQVALYGKELGPCRRLRGVAESYIRPLF